MNPTLEQNAPALLSIVVVLVAALFAAIFHAIHTRRAWRRGSNVRSANVAQLVGSIRTYNAVWGLDTRRAVRKISRLRGEASPPKVSPHFVVAVSNSGLWMIQGARGDQGVTLVRPSEFRSIQTSTSGVGAYTAWYVNCSIRGVKVNLPIRVTHPSSDFLVAEYKWAEEVAATITALLTTSR